MQHQVIGACDMHPNVTGVYQVRNDGQWDTLCAGCLATSGLEPLEKEQDDAAQRTNDR